MGNLPSRLLNGPPRLILYYDCLTPLPSPKFFGQLAVRRFGHAGANVAQFLGVTPSLVNWYAASDKLYELMRFA